VRPVGADEVVAAHLVLDAVGFGEEDAGPVRSHVDHSGVTNPEPYVAAVTGARVCEVDEHVVCG
jgi:hypothetical protein